MFIYQCKMIKLFLGIFRRLKRFLEIFLHVFLTQNCADRPCRSTDVHRPVHVCWHSGPVGRSDQRALLSVSGRSAGRPTGAEKSALCIWAVGRAVDRIAQGHIYDRWRSTGPVDRKPVRLPDQPNG